MGQKVNPIGFRLGVNKECSSIWFETKQAYRDNLHEDLAIKDYIIKRLPTAMISNIKIYRKSNTFTIEVFTARPGQVIGKKGAEIDLLRKEIYHLVNKKREEPLEVFININEIKKMWADAKLVGREIARQLQNRISFRRVMKFAIRNAMRDGVEGIKLQCSGRLGGAEMSRIEIYKEGRTPLHLLRADIDYALTTAQTTYGIIGIKVWIYKGDIHN